MFIDTNDLGRLVDIKHQSINDPKCWTCRVYWKDPKGKKSPQFGGFVDIPKVLFAAGSEHKNDPIWRIGFVAEHLVQPTIEHENFDDDDFDDESDY